MSVRVRVGVIDYGVGNLRSVCSALEKVGAAPVLSADPETLLACDKIILPGVGAFAHGIEELNARGLAKVVIGAATLSKPTLGICLGMQLLAERSLEFGDTQGLGLVPGTVTKLDARIGAPPLRLPHVAWKPLVMTGAGFEWLFDGIDRDARYYFIHSFALWQADECALATAQYEGYTFVAAVGRGRTIGTQFHPEKSGAAGLRLLSNFVSQGV